MPLRVRNSALHVVDVDLETLPVDEELFRSIRADMLAVAGIHRPADGWLQAGGADAPSAPSSQALIHPWLGFGGTRMTPQSARWYYETLKSMDSLGLSAHYFDSEGRVRKAAANLRVSDLGTIFDLSLLARHLIDAASADPIRVVEVGGGYGRLAEAFLNVFEGQVKYVLIDAVPATLAYAWEYMRRSNPNARVGSAAHGHPFDLTRYDCYLVPSWRLEVIGDAKFDCAINVQSMQEMDQHHVDFYLDWFDRGLHPGGLVYLCNRRDHEFRGEWRFPSHWQALEKRTTPRSWTRDFPAEVYRKGNRSYAAENAQVERRYAEDVAAHRAAGLEIAARTGYPLY